MAHSWPLFSSVGTATQFLRISLLPWSFHRSTLAWWMVQCSPRPTEPPFPALTPPGGWLSQSWAQPLLHPQITASNPSSLGSEPGQPWSGRQSCAELAKTSGTGWTCWSTTRTGACEPPCTRARHSTAGEGWRYSCQSPFRSSHDLWPPRAAARASGPILRNSSSPWGPKGKREAGPKPLVVGNKQHSSSAP